MITTIPTIMAILSDWDSESKNSLKRVFKISHPKIPVKTPETIPIILLLILVNDINKQQIRIPKRQINKVTFIILSF